MREEKKIWGASSTITNVGDGQNHPMDHLVGPATEGLEPWQLQYYDPPTHNVIECTKQFSHSDATSINPFPVQASFNSRLLNILMRRLSNIKIRAWSFQMVSRHISIVLFI